MSLYSEMSFSFTKKLTPLQHGAFDYAVDVERQQLHALRQDELAGRGGTGTVLAIAGQDLCTLVHQVFPHCLRVVVQHPSDCCDSATQCPHSVTIVIDR